MKRVLYTCPFVPAEWIRAHGLQPSRVMPRPIPAAATPRSGVCPYAWAFLQTALAEDAADAVVFSTRCDQMRRLAERAGADADMPVFLLNMPAIWQTDAARTLYESELRRLGRFLLDLGGEAPSHSELVAVARRYDERREALRSTRTRLGALHYWKALADFARSGESDIDAAGTPPADGAVRLALVGGPMMQHEKQLFDLIERTGGTVVLDATVSGELGLPPPIDGERLAADPFAALADAYWQIPDASRRPNDRLYEWLEQRIAERQVQGIVFRHYTWCDTWHGEAQRLKEWAPVPVVVTVAGAEEQLDHHLASRIEAFIEMLR